MLADDRGPSGRGQGCHIESVSNIGPAAGDGPSAAHLSRITIDRCDTNQRGDTTPIEFAEFRQISDQGARGNVSSARYRCQEIIGGAPDGRTSHRVVDFAIQFGELGFKSFRRRLDRPGATAKTRPDGRTWTSRRSFETSMLTNHGEAGACSMTRPCECRLDERPRRLFGFRLEPVDGAPCFFSGSIALGSCGLPSTDSLSASSRPAMARYKGG